PLQYIVMMLYLAGDRAQGQTLLRVGAVLVTGVGLWAVLRYTQSLTPVYLALAYGFTQAHLLIDAGAWKLKLPRQRAIIGDSFDFLLHPPAAPAALPRPALGRP